MDSMAMLEAETTGEVVEWHALRPIIDAALNELNESHREAILLKYFSGQDLPEVAAAFACTENAARMRVSRALEKLRNHLAQQGVTSTSMAISQCLRQQTATVLPVGLAAGITAASVSAATITAAQGGFFTLMALSKTKVALTALIVGGVSIPLVMQRNMQQGLARENAALRQQVSDLEQTKNAEPAPGLDEREPSSASGAPGTACPSAPYLKIGWLSFFSGDNATGLLEFDKW